jgi:hypothetical protein
MGLFGRVGLVIGVEWLGGAFHGVENAWHGMANSLIAYISIQNEVFIKDGFHFIISVSDNIYILAKRKQSKALLGYARTSNF